MTKQEEFAVKFLQSCMDSGYRDVGWPIALIAGQVVVDATEKMERELFINAQLVEQPAEKAAAEYARQQAELSIAEQEKFSESNNVYDNWFESMGLYNSRT